ncbi:MAG: phosphohydrolase [Acidovorax sp.]
MKLVALNIDTIPLGQPLPFVLRGSDGALLANRGFVIKDRTALETLMSGGRELCMDPKESADSHRAYLAQLQGKLMSSNATLGDLAATKLDSGSTVPAHAQPPRPAPAAASARPDLGPPAWPELQLRATQLLRAPQAHDFSPRFEALLQELAYRTAMSPDATLLALIHISAVEVRMYSATHAMLTSVACMVTARETLHWSNARIYQAGCAALSMNLAMTELQDQLAQQAYPLTAAQIQAIDDHAERSEALLRELGVTDAVWLEAVRGHHHRQPGPLAERSEGSQIARLIQRADVFGARIAPRATRSPMPVTAAMQNCYYDEAQKVDEAGSALVKTLGIYPPGALVRLATGEVGVVLRRGATANTPRVAVVLNREGMATGEPIPRSTEAPQWKITGPVAHKDVRVSWPLAKLLALV